MPTPDLAKWLLCLAPVWGTSAIFSRDRVYNESEARMFASLSASTYCEDVSQLLNWSCHNCIASKTPLVPGKIRLVDGGWNNATRVIIGKLRDQEGCVMAFRGSLYKTNWIRNFEFWSITPKADFGDCPGCKVHDGFYQVWDHVRDRSIKALREVGCNQGGKDNLIYVTGHSMGAAITHLAMFALNSAGFEVAKTYSFEAPRVGNAAFAEAFAKSFSFPVFRITHFMDPVVHLPPVAAGYQHVQMEVYYNKTGQYKICERVEDPSCSSQFSDVPDMLLHDLADHCGSPLVSTTHSFCAGCGGSEQVIV